MNVHTFHIRAWALKFALKYKPTYPISMYIWFQSFHYNTFVIIQNNMSYITETFLLINNVCLRFILLRIIMQNFKTFENLLASCWIRFFFFLYYNTCLNLNKILEIVFIKEIFCDAILHCWTILNCKYINGTQLVSYVNESWSPLNT